MRYRARCEYEKYVYVYSRTTPRHSSLVFHRTICHHSPPPHISDHFTSLGNYRICHYVLLAVSSAAAAQRIPLTRHKGPLEASLDGPGGFDFTFLMVCHCFTTCSMACKWLIVGHRAARKAAIADVISVTNNPLFLILIGTSTFIE